MIYREFGKNGPKISQLGFGCMRLPMVEGESGKVVDQDQVDRMMAKAYELGINYFDTALFYNDRQSEPALGKALKSFRKNIMLATKCPGGNVKQPGDLRKVLEEQLTKLQTDYLDYYYLHGIGWDNFNEVEARGKWIEDAMRAKEEGLIKHLSFSFHDKVENMIKLIDTGYFETVLCQYNLLDRSNESGMKYAHEKGMGVVVMGPLGGGRIAGLPDEIAKSLGINVQSSVELALKFVLSNPNVSCAISGMGSVDMVEQNCGYASKDETLTAEEAEAINALMVKNRKLSDLYCTGCNYCMPCPAEVNIPHIFRLMNYYKVYGIQDYARKGYKDIGSRFVKGKHADACTECGACEEKCPQKLKIREQLKESHSALSDL